MACMDTTFLIDLGRRAGERRVRAERKLKELVASGARLVTTRFNVAELNVGVFRSDNPASERAAVTSLLAGIEIIEFDETAALIFARITARLQELGRPVGDMDALIAATALAANEPLLVTRNTVHFAGLPGLDVQGY